MKLAIKDPDEIRDDQLRTLRLGLLRRGVTNPNVSPGSDDYVRAQAVGNELAVAEANGQNAVESALPDTATDEDLTRIAGIYKLTLRPASGSVGPAILESSAPATLATNQELLDGAGLRYAVLTGATVADGDTFTVYALATGDETNLPEGTKLRWAAAPAYCSDTVTIGVGGLVNGAPAEGLDDLRRRLLERIRNPPKSGNWSHVADLAEATDPAVQKAFVYPAIQGPGTTHVAVAARPTKTNKSRAVAAAKLAAKVIPGLESTMPERAYLKTTTVEDVNVDVCFGLTLPEAALGETGGWTSPTPWPNVDGTSTFRVTVKAVTSGTVITVEAYTEPTPNVSRVSWIDRFDADGWKVRSALVTGFTGIPGLYVITLDSPFVGVAVNDFVFPECANAQAYLDALLDAFAALGPGEKSSNAQVLSRGFRRPGVGQSWRSDLDAHLLQTITSASEEVETAQYLHRTDGVVTLQGPLGRLTPQLPASVDLPPKQFIPRRIAFMRLP